MNMYLQFLSFLHTRNVARKHIPGVAQSSTYPFSQENRVVALLFFYEKFNIELFGA